MANLQEIYDAIVRASDIVLGPNGKSYGWSKAIADTAVELIDMPSDDLGHGLEANAKREK
jgi:hypothetical protein